MRQRRKKDIVLFELAEARFACKSRNTIDLYATRATHSDPAGAAEGERGILLVLHGEERIQHSELRPRLDCEALYPRLAVVTRSADENAFVHLVERLHYI